LRSADVPAEANCSPIYIPTVPEYAEDFGPYRTSWLSVGFLCSVILFGLFLEQSIHTFSNMHREYRRHVYWITSIYPFTTLMSTLALLVPRSHKVCEAVKIIYLSVGVAHFADITVLLHGGEAAMVEALSEVQMRFDVPPLGCCLFFALPRPYVTKWKLRIVYILVGQMPFTQFIFYFLTIYLMFAESMSYLSYILLESFNVVSFILGVYSLQILNKLSTERLALYSYKKKSLAMKALVLLCKFQGLIFRMLGRYGAFPCNSRTATTAAYQYTAQNSLFILEMIIFGLLSYYMYRSHEFDQFPPRHYYKQKIELPDAFSADNRGADVDAEPKFTNITLKTQEQHDTVQVDLH